MSVYFPKPKSLGENVKVELELPNYATKADLKNAIGVYFSLTRLQNYLVFITFSKYAFNFQTDKNDNISS